jgi:hypothetical protein
MFQSVMAGPPGLAAGQPGGKLHDPAIHDYLARPPEAGVDARLKATAVRFNSAGAFFASS